MVRRFLVTILFALFLLFISGVIGEKGVLPLRSRSAAAQDNTPPALDLNGGGAGKNFSTFFVPGGAAVSIVDSGLTVSDADSPNLSSATITITNLKDTGAESLGVDTSGTVITIDSSSPGSLVLNGPDSIANFQQVLQSTTYQNSSPTPDMTTRQVSFVVNDGEVDSNQPISSIQFADPAILISKEPDSQTIVAGGTANFSIHVENSGNVPLTNIAVSDVLAQECEVTIPSLNPGEVFPIDCEEPNVSEDFTNTASVTADYGSGTVNASDTANVQVAVPGISISKTPDSQTVASGDSAEFSIKIKNTGAVTLTNIAVSDVLAQECEVTIPSLNPGEVFPIDCEEPNVSEDFTNTASVTADYGFGEVTDSDTAEVIIAKPKVEIDKKPGTQTIIKGTAAAFTIDVKNSGNVPLSNIVVSDDESTDCEETIPSLSPGSTYPISCTEPNVTADFTNIASVTADHSYGAAVSANDLATVKVVNPAIKITKTADTPIIIKGKPAEFSIKVENIGDVALKDIKVSDLKAPGCAKTIATLNPGQPESYSCSLNSVLSTFTNEASVQAEDNFNHTVTDKDTANVQVINPNIVIRKSTSTPKIAKGGTAIFKIEIENTGDVPLKNVNVEDELVPSCELNNSTLAPGQVRIINCSLANVTADFRNKASVQAKDDYGNVVADIDSVWVEVQNPDISIVKTPSTQTILKGETATFYITVVNPSKVVDLTEVKVVDLSTPECNETIGLLGKGEPYYYVCEKASVTDPFTNTIEVSGRNIYTNQTVTDSSTANVEILDMQVAMKINPPIITTPGDAAEFTVTIKNEGSVSFKLQSLVVDPLGSLTDPNNSNIGENNSCEGASQIEVDPGDTFTCSFTADAEEDLGIYTYKLSVAASAARDNDNKPVSGTASPSLIVGNSDLLLVTLEADPSNLSAPVINETVVEKIKVTNLSKASTLTLDTLIHSELGNLNNVGDCELPKKIGPNNKSYSCEIEINLSGGISNSIYHEVAAAGLTEDGKTAGNIAQTTIHIFDETSWLPLISYEAPPAETITGENDKACLAFPLIPNLNYRFKLDGENNWYQFDVSRSSSVNIEVHNLRSQSAQVIVYKNDNCKLIKEEDADKIPYSAGNAPDRMLNWTASAGHYFIRVTADDYSSGAIYSLKVTQ